MNDNLSIKAEGLAKKYCKSLKRSMLYGILDIARNIIGLRSYPEKLRKDEFWALYDLEFEFKKGETVGVIGGNGSGKTTLLKMLNGIFWPDRGKLSVNGKVGALIEVGAGFQPLLTGRENIYINGAVLGMSKSEVEAKFQSIVEFAEIGEFIDVPVKHYSSGMFVRLGFAIAVHSEPELLLVDEILSVGDEKFRNKCQNRIDELKKSGVTIIYVSHDLMSVKRLCSRAVWLDKGRVAAFGAADRTVNAYLDSLNEVYNTELAGKNKTQKIRRFGTGEAVIKEVVFAGGKQVFKTGDDIIVEVECFSEKGVKNPLFGAIIHSAGGVYISGTNSSLGEKLEELKGRMKVRYVFEKIRLLPGNYFLSLAIHNEEGRLIYDLHEQSYEFMIAVSSTEKVPVSSGFMELDCKWEYKR